MWAPSVGGASDDQRRARRPREAGREVGVAYRRYTVVHLVSAKDGERTNCGIHADNLLPRQLATTVDGVTCGKCRNPMWAHQKKNLDSKFSCTARSGQ